MCGKLYFLSVVFCMLFSSASSGIYAQKTSDSTVKPQLIRINPQPTPEPLKIGKIKIAPPTKFEDKILEEINFVRTKPAEYAAMLANLRKYYKDTTFSAPGSVVFRTLEGAAALDEAIGVLEKTQPLEALKTVCADVRASRDHLADLQKSGSFSHFGSDGSSPEERLKKYVEGNVLSSENLVGRNGTAREIVLMMVLDDGVSSRIHRKNLLDPRFKFAGVSNGVNISKMNLTVVVFSDNSAEKTVCEINE